MRNEHLLDVLEAGPDPAAVPDGIADALRELPPSELADLIEASPPERRPALWQSASAAQRGELLVQTRGDVRAQLIAAAESEELVAALGDLQLDELADLESSVPEAEFERLLESMSRDARRRFDTLRRHPHDTAGGLMDIDVLAVPLALTLAEVQARLRGIREKQGSLPEHVDSLFVVDERQCYIGRLTLADLVGLPPETAVSSAVLHDLEALPASMPAYEAARRFENLDLISAPVADADGRLIGRITIDDVVDVIRSEGENAMLGMAGLDRDIDPFGSVFSSARRRSIWIGVHVLNALIAAWVIGQFQNSIEQLVALAVLMPVVAGVGGVGGMQSLALVTRGIALDQIRTSNTPRLFGSEFSVSLLNGALWAVLVGSIVYLWFGNAGLAVVFGSALAFNLMNGAVVGTSVPIMLSRLGIDPAIAGGVLLVAATDVLGFLIFLGLATLFLV